MGTSEGTAASGHELRSTPAESLRMPPARAPAWQAGVGVSVSTRSVPATAPEGLAAAAGQCSEVEHGTRSACTAAVVLGPGMALSVPQRGYSRVRCRTAAGDAHSMHGGNNTEGMAM